MPKQVRYQITARQVKTLPPGKHADGAGLYLRVRSEHSRLWIWRGQVHGRRREISIGNAYKVSLADARQKAAEWGEIAREGGDPGQVRDGVRGEKRPFRDVATELWREKISVEAKSEKHAKQWMRLLDVYAFPMIGNTPIGDVSESQILAVLRPIWLEKPETARRVKQRISATFEYARVAGIRKSPNPTDGVQIALPRQPVQKAHYEAISVSDAPRVFAEIGARTGMGAICLQWVILTACRSGEARAATWDEIDVQERLWTIPANRTKQGREHRVPLPGRAMMIFDALPRKHPNLMFSSGLSGKPLSDMSLLAVHRRLGYSAAVHGWRSTFRDFAAERTNFPEIVPEQALGHSVSNKTEAAYRRTDLLDRRRDLMQIWADYLTLS